MEQRISHGRVHKKKKDKVSFNDLTWRKKKETLKEQREQKLVKQFEASKVAREERTQHKEEEEAFADEKPAGTTPFSLSIAIPGSFLNLAQCDELRAYMAVQVARAATIYRLEEIIVYDETGRMKQEEVDAYWSGKWQGDLKPSERNIEGNFHLAKILEYLECPQYIRKPLFPFHKALRSVGLLHPLDSAHHLKATDFTVPYREGVVLDKPCKKGRGVYVDVGLDKELFLENSTPFPPATRITVELTETGEDRRLYKGRLANAKQARDATSLYWGYSVRIAKTLGEVMDRKKYDVVLGMTPNGGSMNDVEINLMTRKRILVIFGGVQGVEAALEGDETVSVPAEQFFDQLVNPLPFGSGSRSERVEETVLITLSNLSLRLSQMIL
ncbi:unnamed protein product, partial [Mesorhabditis spiculigera]